MDVDNDTRGWIMTCVSGIGMQKTLDKICGKHGLTPTKACVIGASVICVDLIIQRIPSKRNFRIQDSNVFLSSSLSLSFGVMLFSSLYGMLPSAKNYLVEGGFGPRPAAYILIACFLSGVVGIQAVSRILHHFIPSNVVDCDHTHDEQERSEDKIGSDAASDHENGHPHNDNEQHFEDSPLLSREMVDSKPQRRSRSATFESEQRLGQLFTTAPASRRPSLQHRLKSRVSTFVTGAKSSCDENGPCHGYSDPCGQECFKALSRSPTRLVARRSASTNHGHPGLLRTPTVPFSRATRGPLGGLDEELDDSPDGNGKRLWAFNSTPKAPRGRQDHLSTDDLESGQSSSSSTAQPPVPDAHHHHVPQNAFLSIGLQTSIAIALHKLPEGFITFATNHANPELGFAVFVALFIHNITEGFAMALPLYLALGSRWKAMFWSSLLGGFSQPLGAGVAALWFKIAGRGDMAPGERVYGCMFAVTAGIMTSVALQLFSESLGLTHNRNLCTAFAFIGMGILGISFALTAE
ncbi:hypothetical protein MMC09_002633 [Bachmanniomyces sp. S44760]|nr:hypothetical protein [Bachmanniomyces sp. S44760]